MKRRNFLIGVGSTAVSGSALVGSGAFNRVESQREFHVEVSEDPDAYLGLDQCDSPNGSYAHIDDSGGINILMNDENPKTDGTPLGEGVNTDATTRFDRVFQFCNQGTEEACVWIADHEDWPTDENGNRRVEFYLEDDGMSIIGEENAIPLAVGECVCIGIEVRTDGLSAGETLLGTLDDRITITADVDGDCLERCPVLDAEYECTLFDKNGLWKVFGHNVAITNAGDDTGEYFWATLGEEKDDHRRLDSPVVVEPGETHNSLTSTKYPTQGLIWWTDECTTGTVTEYAEFFDNHDGVGLDDVPETADAVSISGFPSRDDFEASEYEGAEIGDVVSCDI